MRHWILCGLLAAAAIGCRTRGTARPTAARSPPAAASKPAVAKSLPRPKAGASNPIIQAGVKDDSQAKADELAAWFKRTKDDSPPAGPQPLPRTDLEGVSPKQTAGLGDF